MNSRLDQAELLKSLEYGVNNRRQGRFTGKMKFHPDDGVSREFIKVLSDNGCRSELSNSAERLTTAEIFSPKDLLHVTDRATPPVGPAAVRPVQESIHYL
jgi:hypothetical protein